MDKIDIKKICEEYRTDKENIQNIVDTFDEKESMLISKVEDSMSFKSKVAELQTESDASNSVTSKWTGWGIDPFRPDPKIEATVVS